MIRIILNFVVFCVWLGVSGASSQEQIDVSKFFGTFVGMTKDIKENATPQELRISIKAYQRDGFKVDWITVAKKNGEMEKTSQLSVAFKPTNRAGIFGSAMKTDIFGNRTPLNPLSGDPFVWATLSNNTLRIHQLIISDDGGYELNFYKRSLNQEGLDVEFARHRDGKRLASIPIQMTRVKDSSK